MKPRRLATAIAVLVCSSMIAFAPAGPSWGAPKAAAPRPIHMACGGKLRVNMVRCFAEWKAGVARMAVRAGAVVTPPGFGYGPADIAAAYQLDTTMGAGQTVAIVDAFDNPRIAANLAAFRSAYGLPPCGAAKGCFRKVNQRGGKVAPQPDPGWGVEIALDVQAVSAACPLCKILLVEADYPDLLDMGKAVNTAVRLGANVVSNSYGADEAGPMFDIGNRFYTHPGVAQVASSGDYGFGPASFPAVWGGVIGAGGTTLTQPTPGVWTEQAWSGAGSGCSAWIDKPAWQHDGHCLMRTVADVSAVADPNTGFAVYDTFGLGPSNGWIQVGGTSLSSPLIAGMIGLAGNGAQMDTPQHIYDNSSGLYDVVGGTNGYCGGDYLCRGKVGYDGPTGMGSPRGVSAL